jgi:uncharacterized protein YdiU (UPF0061 family)
MRLQRLLPSTSFVAFGARRVASARLLWSSSAAGPGFDWRASSYAMPVQGETGGDFGEESCEFLGERYGGEAIGHNGGGVRCGLLGNIQVKGIGRNPLAGTKTEFWHTFGGSSLEEGLREAIWSEVCHAALPYRTARVLALVLTGSRIPYLAPEGERTARRVLILREPALRPAHFMRTMHFDPDDGRQAGLVCDTERTRAAVRAAAQCMSALFRGAGDVDDADWLNHCLREMARRHAIQLAAAHARRIMHGTLGSSNVSVDGRWMDFGTITAVSDYGRLIVGRNDSPDFTQEHHGLALGLRELRFHLRKFLPAPTANGLVSAQELLHLLHETLQRRRAVEMLKLCGIPEQGLAHVPRALAEPLYRCMSAIAMAGNAEPFKLAPTHLWRMPKRSGRYHLSTLLGLVAARRVPDTAERAGQSLAEELPDLRLREELQTRFDAVHDAYLQALPAEQRHGAAEFIVLNALRRNTAFEALYRPDFERMVARLSEDEQAIAPTIDRLTRRAQALYGEPREGWLDLAGWLGAPVSVHFTEGLRAPTGQHLCTLVTSLLPASVEGAIA